MTGGAPTPSFDVAVVGGGSAGVAAALSAARLGARTALLERERRLGGNVANARVHTICGLYLADEVGPHRLANAGFPARLARAMSRGGVAGAPERVGRVVVLPIDPDGFADFTADLCRRAPSLTTAVDAPLRSVELARHGGERSVVTYGDVEAPRRLNARVVVDATGDGEVAALGGGAFALAAPRQRQAMSFIFTVGGVAASSFNGFSRLQLSALVAHAWKGGALPDGCESVLIRAGASPDQVHITLNVPAPSQDGLEPLDPTVLAHIRATAGERAEFLLAFLRGCHPAFLRAQMAVLPPRVGVRETRRLVGEEVVTAEHVLAGRRSDRDVALSTWPIELWTDHRRARFTYPVGPCGVPLGALRSASHPELAMAGRCLSATADALGALRVIGTALATGEAAGVAAGLAADGGVPLRSIDAAAVRARIDRTTEEEMP